MTDTFSGEYAIFYAADKPSGELLQTPDFIVGDVFDVEFRVQDGEQIAWMRNRFGGYAGYLDANTSRRLAIMAARGWTLHGLLSFVAYTDLPEPGYYWGQMALVCYDPQLARYMEPWMKNLGAKMGEGVRPSVDLTDSEVARVQESGGTWIPSGRVAMPTAAEEKSKSAIIKKTRSLNDKIVELGRGGKAGCLVVGWVFNIALVAGVAALILHWCGVF